jgi:hypothetical protein
MTFLIRILKNHAYLGHLIQNEYQKRYKTTQSCVGTVRSGPVGAGACLDAGAGAGTGPDRVPTSHAGHKKLKRFLPLALYVAFR